MPRPRIIHGDCREVMRQLIAEGVQVDSLVADPPYHLESIVKRFGSANAAPAQTKQTGAFARASAGFMGQQWDGADENGSRIAFEVEVWSLALQLLKPGGHLLAFGGTRTFHRMVCAIEDAGFDIRDMLAWTYASGFPKSRDVSRDIDKLLGQEREVVGQGRGGPAMKMGGENGRAWHAEQAANGGKFDRTAPASEEAKRYEDYRTALKPALEPICMARKPLAHSSIARNVLELGTGALNIGACRVEFESIEDLEATKAKNAHAQFDSGPRTNHVYKPDQRAREDYDATGRWPANLLHDGSAEVLALFPDTAPARSGKPRSGRTAPDWAMTHTGAEYDDTGGSAARFFFTAKADDTDRVYRCKACGARNVLGEPSCHPGQSIRHPTVKPLDLMRWMVRLVTPPGGTVLDPFAGTGSTGIAADREGFHSILIEQSADFVGDIEFRLAAAGGAGTPLFGGAHG